MERLLHHVGAYADIDTRRALGLPPRKLPPSNLPLRTDFKDYIELYDGKSKIIVFDEAGVKLYVSPDTVTWQFNTRNFPKSRTYVFRRDGQTSFYSLMKLEHSFHPDLNKDGSFKRSFSAVF